MTAGVFFCLLVGGGTEGQDGGAKIGGGWVEKVGCTGMDGAQAESETGPRLVGDGKLLDKRGWGTETLVATVVDVGDVKVIETVGRRDNDELDGGRRFDWG